MFTACETLKSIAKIYTALLAREALQLPLVIGERLHFLAQENCSRSQSSVARFIKPDKSLRKKKMTKNAGP